MQEQRNRKLRPLQPDEESFRNVQQAGNEEQPWHVDRRESLQHIGPSSLGLIDTRPLGQSLQQTESSSRIR
ncbi:hypothetical protein D3C84_1203060 [compost metagenome]